MFLWEWSIAKPHKRSPVIIDLTQVLGLPKAENECSQHSDEYSHKGLCLQVLVQIAAQVYFDEQEAHQL